MVAAVPFDVRAVPDDQLEAVLKLGCLAFHAPPLEADEHARLERFLAGSRRFGAYDEGVLVGVGGTLDFALSIPGGELPCAGLTWVAVAPTHRRRGALTAIMAELLADARGRGQPLAALWAAEGAIYGRYGFGVATHLHEIELDTRAALEFRTEVDARPLRLIDRDAAASELGPAHARERARRPGMPARTPHWWREAVLHTPPEMAAAGLGEARVVVLGAPGDVAGYAIYRVRAPDVFEERPGRVVVAELVADDTAAEAALWRYLASIDLTTSVLAWNRPVDDALPLMLADQDRVTNTRRMPALWLRILDVPAALSARSREAPVSTTLGVREPSGALRAWRLHDGRCEPAAAAPDLELHLRDLGSVYLGGVSLFALHAAGLVVEHTPGSVTTLDAALRTPLAPHIVDDF
jgi:predicted acetyltransferase